MMLSGPNATAVAGPLWPRRVAEIVQEGDVPQPDDAIAAGDGQPLAVGTESDGMDNGLWFLNGIDKFVLVEVPNRPGHRARRGEPRPGWAVGDGGDAIAMPGAGFAIRPGRHWRGSATPSHAVVLGSGRGW